MCVTFCHRREVLYWNHHDCSFDVTGRTVCHQKANYASNFGLTNYASRNLGQAMGPPSKSGVINQPKNGATDDVRVLTQADRRGLGL